MVCAVSPCLSALNLTFLRPAAVLGPVDLFKFRLFASIFRCEVMLRLLIEMQCSRSMPAHRSRAAPPGSPLLIQSRFGAR